MYRLLVVLPLAALLLFTLSAAHLLQPVHHDGPPPRRPAAAGFEPVKLTRSRPADLELP